MQWCFLITFSVIIADEDSHDLAPNSGENSESSTEEVKTVNAKPEEAQDPEQPTEANPSPASDTTIPKEDKPATPPPSSDLSTSSD
jgi:hypothetical protein